MAPRPAQPLIPPGSLVRIAQRVRVGDQAWTTFVTGTVEADGTRPVGGMEMGGKARFTQQPTVRLRLSDGEITVVAVDEGTRYEVLNSAEARP